MPHDPLPDGTQVFRIGTEGIPFGFDFSPRELTAISNGTFNGPPGISVVRADSAEEARAIWNEAMPNRPATTVKQASVEDIRVAGFDVIHDPSKRSRAKGGLGESRTRFIHPDGPDGHNTNKGKLSDMFTCGGE